MRINAQYRQRREKYQMILVFCMNTVHGIANTQHAAVPLNKRRASVISMDTICRAGSANAQFRQVNFARS